MQNQLLAEEKEIALSELLPGDILTFEGEDNLLDNLIMSLTNHSKVSHGALFMQKNSSAEGDAYILADAGQSGIHAHVMSQDFDHKKPEEEIRVLHVSRHVDADQNGVLPVVQAAKNYVFEDLPYPYADLVLLGMILIYKNVTNVSLKHDAVVEFLRLLTAEVKTWIDAHRKNPAHTMVCSSYVYQCYLDASAENPQFKLDLKNADAGLDTLLGAFESFMRAKGADWEAPFEDFEEPLLLSNFRPMADILKDLIQTDSHKKTVMLPKKELFEAVKEFLKVLMKLACKDVHSLQELIENAKEQQAMFVTPNDLYCHVTNTKKVGILKIIRLEDDCDSNLGS